MQQEEEKYKTPEAYHAEALALVEEFRFQEAQEIMETALSMYPDDTLLIDEYADLLLNTDQLDKAQQLKPDLNTKKYFNLAELRQGIEALSLYEKGIMRYEARSEDLGDDERQELAKAYSSVGELFMTDLCFEEKAEEKTEEAFKLALSHFSDCIDALQGLANLRILRKRDAEARVLLEKVVKILLSQNQDEPALEFRKQTVRLLIGIEEYEAGVKILNKLIKEENEDPEIWYLLAFCHFKIKKYQLSRECLQTLGDVIKLPGKKNNEIIEAAQEIEEKLGLVETQKEEEDSDGYETVSDGAESTEDT